MHTATHTHHHNTRSDTHTPPPQHTQRHTHSEWHTPPYHHCAIIAPSLHHHHTITAPGARPVVRPNGVAIMPALRIRVCRGRLVATKAAANRLIESKDIKSRVITSTWGIEHAEHSNVAGIVTMYHHQLSWRVSLHHHFTNTAPSLHHRALLLN